MHTKFWSENVKGRNHLEDLDVDGRPISGCKTSFLTRTKERRSDKRP
jgi:hypothetical protein